MSQEISTTSQPYRQMTTVRKTETPLHRVGYSIALIAPQIVAATVMSFFLPLGSMAMILGLSIGLGTISYTWMNDFRQHFSHRRKLMIACAFPYSLLVVVLLSLGKLPRRYFVWVRFGNPEQG